MCINLQIEKLRFDLFLSFKIRNINHIFEIDVFDACSFLKRPLFPAFSHGCKFHFDVASRGFFVNGSGLHWKLISILIFPSKRPEHTAHIIQIQKKNSHRAFSHYKIWFHYILNWFWKNSHSDFRMNFVLKWRVCAPLGAFFFTQNVWSKWILSFFVRLSKWVWLSC